MESKFKPNDLILIEFIYYEEPEIGHQEYDFLIGIFIELENDTHVKVSIYNEKEKELVIKTFPIDSIRKIYSRSENKTLENINIICGFSLKQQFMELKRIASINIEQEKHRKKSLRKHRNRLMSYILKGNFYDDER